MSAKETNKAKLLDYLGNPENEFLSRGQLALTVLGYKHEASMYRHLSPKELQEIENDAIEIRKKNASRQRCVVLTALYKQAKDGDVGAAKEWLNRVEGKVPDKVDAHINIERTRIVRRKTRDIEK